MPCRWPNISFRKPMWAWRHLFLSKFHSRAHPRVWLLGLGCFRQKTKCGAESAPKSPPAPPEPLTGAVLRCEHDLWAKGPYALVVGQHQRHGERKGVPATQTHGYVVWRVHRVYVFYCFLCIFKIEVSKRNRL